MKRRVSDIVVMMLSFLVLLALAAGLVPVFVALLLLRARLAALLRACLFDTALHLFTALRLLRRALLLRTRRGLLAFAAGFATLGATFVALFLARLAVVVIVVRTLLGEGGCNATGGDQRTEYRGEAMAGGETGHLAFSEYGTNPSRRLGPVSDWANEWPLIFSSHARARKRAFRNRRSGRTALHRANAGSMRFCARRCRPAVLSQLRWRHCQRFSKRARILAYGVAVDVFRVHTLLAIFHSPSTFSSTK